MDTAFDATVAIPGSKSITNRAIVCAVLASGSSTLRGALDADDTRAMLGIASALGANPSSLDDSSDITIAGTGGVLMAPHLGLDVRMSGTTARFATPLAARVGTAVHVDGAPEMRARPMASTADALRLLGCSVDSDVLPMAVTGPLRAGEITLPADVSSQFASGLMLAAPGLDGPLAIELAGDVVSWPYLIMTQRVMQAFGADVEQVDGNRFIVQPQPYVGTDFAIEPDASAASYFFAAAAVTGGRVRIDGLSAASLQGDVGFVDVLEAMGAEVDKQANAIEVRGTGELRGIDVDMSDISDTAQTLAAIAPFASGPTRVTGIGFIRNKETDRIAAVVAELNRLGIAAVEEADGFVVHPGIPQPGRVATYHDHRMAMSFAITALMSDGIEIDDPDCVAKTFPGFWQVLDDLRG